MTSTILVSEILRRAPNLPRPEDVAEDTIFVLCPACDELRSLANSVVQTGQGISYRCVECRAELIRISAPQPDTEWMEERGYRWDEFFVRPMGCLHFGGLKLRPKPLAAEGASWALDETDSPRPGAGRSVWIRG
jgi:hypothetical protein